jgi:hypothetical protein
LKKQARRRKRRATRAGSGEVMRLRRFIILLWLRVLLEQGNY